MIFYNLYEMLNMCPAMSLRAPHNVSFIPKLVIVDNNIGMSDDDAAVHLFLVNVLGFFHSDYLTKSLEELRSIAENIRLSYNAEEIRYIEEKTITQSSSQLWYRFRAGRVTASNFKAVCRTSVINPSISCGTQTV